ncbi:MAG: NAD(P)H-dependent oxidoreductase [Endomicrobium sp.]|jgi:flavodoxin|nr:NAD(P)H-dependent oxidoreductase [Endomicrobium sp.]
MKNFLVCAAAAFIIGAGILPAFAQAQNTDGGNNKMAAKKILVAYYSHSGNTEKIAKEIQTAAGADIFEIETTHIYPSDYDKLINQAKKEIADDFKPALKTKLNNIAEYDIIFVGSPNWWSSIAPAVSSFLNQHDFSGKTVIPFCTHGGGGLANISKNITKQLENKAVVLNGKAFRQYSSDSKKEIADWLKELDKQL